MKTILQIIGFLYTLFDVYMLQFRQCQYLLKDQINAMYQFLLIQAKWTEIPT